MYDPDTIVERVTEAVGDATERSPEELPPLYDSVDTDAVAAVLGHADGRPTARPRVEFDYAGCAVHVTTDVVEVVDGRAGGTEESLTTIASRPLP